MRLRRLGVGLSVVLAVLLTVTGCTRADDSAGRPSVRVTVSGTALELDRRPWWPTGFDSYQLATDWSVNVGCGAEVDLDAYFATVPPRSLTRFNLFAALAVDKTAGMPNFRAVDAVFAAAARHRRMVLPVLTGGESSCEGDAFKQSDWYRVGWKSAPIRGFGTYERWVWTAVTRWRDEPSLAGWEPVGEPEPADCVGTDCRLAVRTCAADAPLVLKNFFDEVGALIGRLDPGRLIFSGTAGGDQCGTAGDGYLTVARSAALDVLDFHDYPGDVASPSSGSTLTARLAQARLVGKPLMVNELGLRGGSCMPLADRAARYRTRIETIRAQGAAGALLWAFVPDPRLNKCTYDIGLHDPVWAVVEQLGR